MHEDVTADLRAPGAFADPAGRPGVFADPAGRLTAIAGVLLLAALGLALEDVGATAPLALAGAGTVLGLFVLAPRALAGVRRHPVLLAGAVLAVMPVLLIGVFGYVGDGDTRMLGDLLYAAAQLLPAALVALAALGGLVLLTEDLRVRLGPVGLTPWQRLTGTAGAPVPTPWRALAGLTLVGGAALFVLALVGANGGNALLLLVLAAGGLAVIITPLVIAGFARVDRVRADDAREDERRRVAAHLHDSVLQTLALVQRQAHDPAAVARLARRQEHELRAWMAGEAELGAETLGAALRAAVAEVEDDHGAAVELTVLGDRPLDRAADALAAAAREALRNAARHAPGSPIFVFCQAGPDGAEVFVRDEGPGFELAAVPTERRGVRDSIIGRMAAAGGSAEIESRAGEGTEVALRIGVVG
ncbi:MAG TPA: ATP-binding protein [Solirubrobacter sp.]|nr:ATP-binding protein [Solirubrobacter sp.]